MEGDRASPGQSADGHLRLRLRPDVADRGRGHGGHDRGAAGAGRGPAGQPLARPARAAAGPVAAGAPRGRAQPHAGRARRRLLQLAYIDQPGIELFGDDDRGRHFYLDAPFEVAASCVLGVLVLLATPWVMRALTSVDRLLVKGLLGPSRLATRVWELESDRGTVVDTAAADLRRIERDLHDGAQARLVALAMDLGLAKEKLDEDPQAAARMVDEAHGEVKLALQELRDLARGIHPAILTDRGLGPALSALAARCTVPVTVTADLPDRPAPAIEGIAYFTVSELLQNISKHSNARTASVELARSGSRLLIRVRDDGRGGASPDGGSGLAGLAERLGSVDGRFVVDSPPGGPTSVEAELPWRDRDGTSRTGGVPRRAAAAPKGWG
ncbi:two-component system sensor kinase [Streptomyces himastatinicus ATCC 53653]|uniref:histidine kinase n=1 Tax=Streptomyces himastatinicus ATCC 53653 TaxID=457427 RepID=D9WRF3_9ACTN|nr:two-component system sensor kinase [Streptomyces himastatinicus ATCC 53653]